MPSTSISTPAVTTRDDRMHVLWDAGVVCRAMAVQTVSISSPAMPWLRRKSRAALALSTSKRSCALECWGEAHVVEHRAGVKAARDRSGGRDACR